MKQLSGLDASFLYMETANTYGHVNGLAIYERPSGDFDPYQAAYERFDALVGRLEPMRRRLVEVPFELDHPYWIDDPDFDLNFHVRHIGLAPPGGADQLAEQVARIVGRRMDRSRPLWEVYVIEGLADGRWAMLTKSHHATIDGAAGVIMLKMFTDPSPDTPMPEHVDWDGEPVPSDRELLERTMRNLAANPVKGMRLSLRMVRNIAEAAGVDSVSAVAAPGARCAQVGGARWSDRHARAGPPRADPAVAGAADSVQSGGHAAPALRDAVDGARQHQGAQGRHRLHGQRRRDGDLRRRAPRVPAAPRCAARRAAAGDGAGVDPHRRRGGSVDEPRRRRSSPNCRPTATIRSSGCAAATRR